MFSQAWAYIPKKIDLPLLTTETIHARVLSRTYAQYWTFFYGFPPNKPNLYPKMSVFDEKSMKTIPK